MKKNVKKQNLPVASEPIDSPIVEMHAAGHLFEPETHFSTNLFNSDFKVRKIVSGGQTGVDRAGLDVAIALGIEHGGWCPQGRLAEDGFVPIHYQLEEMGSRNYTDRTRQNVVDSEGTLVLYGDRLQGGTLLTTRYAAEFNKPCLKIRLNGRESVEQLLSWIELNKITVLNVAGPRASSDSNIYSKAYRFLLGALS